MIPRQILYWLILIVTVGAVILAIWRFSNITDSVIGATPNNSRGLVPVEEGKVGETL